MNCTKCAEKIEKGQKYRRTKKGAHHDACPTVRIPTAIEFLALLPVIRESARKLGYAVGLHGSLARDFDLIAAPWTPDAADPDDLAEAIKDAAGCIRWRVFRGHGQLSRKNQDDKPHGRLTYAFDWDKRNYENRGYIDLSVMPRMG